jgi:hypothetical protein
MQLRNVVYTLLKSVYGFLYTRQGSIYPSRAAILLQLTKKKRDEGNVWDFLLGLFIGSVGAHILSTLSKPSCPVCKNKLEKGALRCPHCEAELEWK